MTVPHVGTFESCTTIAYVKISNSGPAKRTADDKKCFPSTRTFPLYVAGKKTCGLRDVNSPHSKVRYVLLSSMIAGNAARILPRKYTGQFSRVISPVNLHEVWKNIPTSYAVSSGRNTNGLLIIFSLSVPCVTYKRLYLKNTRKP